MVTISGPDGLGIVQRVSLAQRHPGVWVGEVSAYGMEVVVSATLSGEFVWSAVGEDVFISGEADSLREGALKALLNVGP